MAMIGIDLGTSNSAAAVLRDGRPIIIQIAEGVTLGGKAGKAVRSFVAATADGQILVGEPVPRQVTSNPEGTAAAFKRRMGRRETIRLRKRGFSPAQLSAFLLQKISTTLRRSLVSLLHRRSLPGYFHVNQRAATKHACRIARIEERESTASEWELAADLIRSGFEDAVL